jgi:glutamate 5-kinase
LPHDRHLSSRKLWIAFASEVSGAVIIDDGARDALISKGTSLLPAGVVKVEGEFELGSTIEVMDTHGVVVARGMAAMSSQQAEQSRGKKTTDLAALGVAEVVHRDDLVVFSQL